MRTKGKYRFVDFIRPDLWPHNYTLEQAFGVYRWMVEAADNYPDQRGYGRNALASMLSRSSAYPSEIDPIVSINDLRARLQWALFSCLGGHAAEEWRARFGITVTGVRIIHFPHEIPFDGPTCEAYFQRDVRLFFAMEGNLLTQLNPCHADAVEIDRIELRLSKPPFGWGWVLHYGVDRSVWQHTLAREQAGETFWQLFLRAKDALAAIGVRPKGDDNA